MIKYTCKHCKIEFLTRPSVKRVFCSRKCKHDFAYETKECIDCGKPFTCYKHLDHAYCSRKCSNKRGNNYSGGRIFAPSGYIRIWQPHHPSATEKRGYVCEHRLVMEKIIGRFLKKTEIVHHINGNKHDNRPENLELFSSHSEHMKHHGFNRGVKYWGANKRI